MVEMALAFPILLLVLAGTLEVGKYFNDYLTILDGTREAARYAADGDLVLAQEPSAQLQRQLLPSGGVPGERQC